MGKLKVLQINKLYYPAIGGIERVVQQIAEGLNDEIDMSVLVCQPKGKGCEEVINHIPVKRCSCLGTFFSMPLSFGFIGQLRKQMKDKDILQFHAPFPMADLACLLSGYQGKVALFWHSDVVKQKKLMFFYRPIMERFLKRADVIIVAADGVRNGSSYLGAYKDKCVTVPFAVNKEIQQKGSQYLQQFHPNLNHYVHFLFVGRLVYYKGVDVLMRAFADVENAELTVVGTGDLDTQLKEYAEKHGFLERIHFLGKVSEEELNQAFAKCDVFVLPSIAKSEAFGLVQLEAMAYGKPVINTNLPSGVPEVSIHKETGLTVEPGDEAALQKAMQWMVDHPHGRCQMGERARQRLDENFTL
ncbi:MAG: glycosyltransferase, partial [Lachnospiraceae bacterium]